MKQIPLSQGKHTLVDDKDYDWLSQWKWHAVKDRNTYYAIRHKRIGSKFKRVSMHRFILNAPKGQLVDHKNWDGLDNQRSNIRLCTRSQNQQNRPAQKNGTSIYKGVFWSKQSHKWGAQIRKFRKDYHLGMYHSEYMAALAYDQKAKEIFGDFAYTNF